jgi:hypothetical protein
MAGANIYQIAKNYRTSVEIDREILRGAHQDLARRRCDQRHAAPRKNKKGKKGIQNPQASLQPPDEETNV